MKAKNCNPYPELALLANSDDNQNMISTFWVHYFVEADQNDKHDWKDGRICWKQIRCAKCCHLSKVSLTPNLRWKIDILTLLYKIVHYSVDMHSWYFIHWLSSQLRFVSLQKKNINKISQGKLWKFGWFDTEWA